MTLRVSLALALLATLGACSGNLFGRLPGVSAPRAAALSGSTSLEVQTQNGAAAFFVREAQRGGIDSYVAPDGKTLALQGGLVISAKGYPEALMAANVWQSARLIRSGQSGNAERFHSYLTGNDKTEVRTYACVVAPEGPEQIAIGGAMRAALRMGESCQSLTDSFKNQYWIDLQSGAVLQSRQWIGPLTGTLRTRSLPGGGGSP